MSIPSCKVSYLFIIFIVSEKFAMLQILPHTTTQPVGKPTTDHYIDSLFLSVKNCISKNPVFGHYVL